MGRGGGRDGGGALQGGGPCGGRGRDPVGDDSTRRGLTAALLVLGGGAYIGRVAEDGGQASGRGGSLEVGEGGNWKRLLSSDRQWW